MCDRQPSWRPAELDCFGCRGRGVFVLGCVVLQHCSENQGVFVGGDCCLCCLCWAIWGCSFQFQPSVLAVAQNNKHPNPRIEGSNVLHCITSTRICHLHHTPLQQHNTQ